MSLKDLDDLLCKPHCWHCLAPIIYPDVRINMRRAGACEECASQGKIVAAFIGKRAV